MGLDELAAMAEGLGALTSQAVEDVRSLPDDELLGVISAARRQTRAEYEELAAVAEYTRRRTEQYEASKARGDKRRQREGEFAAEELGMELKCSHYAAERRSPGRYTPSKQY